MNPDLNLYSGSTSHQASTGFILHHEDVDLDSTDPNLKYKSSGFAYDQALTCDSNASNLLNGNNFHYPHFYLKTLRHLNFDYIFNNDFSFIIDFERRWKVPYEAECGCCEAVYYLRRLTETWTVDDSSSSEDYYCQEIFVDILNMISEISKTNNLEAQNLSPSYGT